MGIRSSAASSSTPSSVAVTGRRGVVLTADASSFLLVDRALKEFDPALRKHMRKEIRRVMAPAVENAKRIVQGPPAPSFRKKGRGRRRSTGLRANLARGIRLEQTAGLSSKRVGVFIRQRSTYLPDGAKNLTRKYGARKGRWRHPVFGDTKKWVDQVGRTRYLYDATDPYSAKAEDAIREAIKNAAREAGLIN